MHLQDKPKLPYPILSTILLVFSCQELSLHHQPIFLQGHHLSFQVFPSDHLCLSSADRPDFLTLTITAAINLKSWLAAMFHQKTIAGPSKTMFIVHKCTLVMVQSSDVIKCVVLVQGAAYRRNSVFWLHMVLWLPLNRQVPHEGHPLV